MFLTHFLISIVFKHIQKCTCSTIFNPRFCILVKVIHVHKCLQIIEERMSESISAFEGT